MDPQVARPHFVSRGVNLPAWTRRDSVGTRTPFRTTPRKITKRHKNLGDTWTPKRTRSLNKISDCPSRPLAFLGQPKSPGSWQPLPWGGRASLYTTGTRVVPRSPTKRVGAPSRVLRRRAPACANPATACLTNKKAPRKFRTSGTFLASYFAHLDADPGKQPAPPPKQ